MLAACLVGIAVLVAVARYLEAPIRWTGSHFAVAGEDGGGDVTVSDGFVKVACSVRRCRLRVGDVEDWHEVQIPAAPFAGDWPLFGKRSDLAASIPLTIELADGRVIATTIPSIALPAYAAVYPVLARVVGRGKPLHFADDAAPSATSKTAILLAATDRSWDPGSSATRTKQRAFVFGPGKRLRDVDLVAIERLGPTAAGVACRTGGYQQVTIAAHSSTVELVDRRTGDVVATHAAPATSPTCPDRIRVQRLDLGGKAGPMDLTPNTIDLGGDERDIHRWLSEQLGTAGAMPALLDEE